MIAKPARKIPVDLNRQNEIINKFAQPHETTVERKIIFEEWKRAVIEYELGPACVTAVVLERILARLPNVG